MTTRSEATTAARPLDRLVRGNGGTKHLCDKGTEAKQQAVVEPCPKCLQAAKEEGAEEVRDQMQARIDELEAELENERRKLAA